MAKKRIGKGLGALIPTELEETILGKKENEKDQKTDQIEVDLIKTALSQARNDFDKNKMKELTASVKEHGILQPLLIRKKGDEYELIAGERRLRAAKNAGLKTVPVYLIEADDERAAEMGLIENLQRENLNAVEEALAYKEMQTKFGHNQESLAKILGKSRSAVANTLRLLSLDEETKKYLEEGKLSSGHGRALLAVKAETRRMQLRDRIIKEHLSVHQAEEAAKLLNEVAAKKKESIKKKKNPFCTEMENKLRDRFQTKIRITGDGKGGKIQLTYHDREELERILELMIEEEK